MAPQLCACNSRRPGAAPLLNAAGGHLAAALLRQGTAGLHDMALPLLLVGFNGSEPDTMPQFPGWAWHAWSRFSFSPVQWCVLTCCLHKQQGHSHGKEKYGHLCTRVLLQGASQKFAGSSEAAPLLRWDGLSSLFTWHIRSSLEPLLLMAADLLSCSVYSDTMYSDTKTDCTTSCGDACLCHDEKACKDIA